MAQITSKQQASYHCRSLKTIKIKLEKMSSDWGDIDKYFEDKFGDLVDEVKILDEELRQHFIDEGVESPIP